MGFLRVGFVSAGALAVLVFASAESALGDRDAEKRLKQTHIVHSDFDPDTYSEPTEIDNKWFPLIPGSQFILDGESDLGSGLLPHRVVFTVTDVTKVINGVRNLVVWDRDFHDGELVEEEIAFFAQDDFRNVWTFGEYPEEYEEGQFIGAPATSLAGVADAEAGIHMRAKPRAGTPPYIQGLALEIDFFNEARVLATNQQTCIPRRCYEKLVVIDEYSPLEPEKGHVYKYYARRVGNIRVEPAGDPELESLALTDLVHLDPQALAEARARTLELDRRAYDVAGDVYGDTPPAEPLGEDEEGDG